MKSSLKLGILGAGQLSRFLSLKAQEMGVHVRVLANSQDEPAVLITKDVVYGDLSQADVRAAFLKDLDVVTFESEFVDASSLEGERISIYPHIQTMNSLRDRKPQKDLLSQYKIPTSPLIPFESGSDLTEWLKGSKKGIVLKKRLFGYDGYGTILIRSHRDSAKIPDDIQPEEWIAEEFCPFKRELAFSIARNPGKDFYVLPLVESKQTDSKCDWVKGPISSPQIRPLISKFKKLMNDLNYVGLLSVELFQTRDELLVNELAPRVHNSAHYSIEALEVGQFEAHLRACLNWPFPSEYRLTQNGFAMANLIGRKGAKLKLDRSPEGFLHWYNKSELKPGRKMGHITALDTTAEKALNRLLKWRKKFCL